MDLHAEDEIRDILELRDWISQEIEKRQREIEKLSQNIRILDSLVKQSSFSKASTLVSHASQSKKSPEPAMQESATVIPMKAPDNEVLANAHLTEDELVIIPAEGVLLDVEMQPFKSFFLGRIIGSMESQDGADVKNG